MARQGPAEKKVQQPSNNKSSTFTFEEAAGKARVGMEMPVASEFAATASPVSGTAPGTEKMAIDITARTKSFIFRFKVISFHLCKQLGKP
jgi:hypothetical protein